MFGGSSNFGPINKIISNIKPDIFTQAREMHDKKQQAQAPVPQPPAQAPVEIPKSVSMIGSLNSAPKMNFEKSDLPKMLQSVGVDDKGLQMNPLGRIQLVSRLQQKFGDYQNNSEAMSILSAFDQNIGKFPMEEAKQINQMGAIGERTLASLLSSGLSKQLSRFGNGGTF